MNPNSMTLYAPINVLKPVAENLWIVDGPVVRMAAPFGTSMPFTTRMTVVRLANGDLWCHSPIALDAELQVALEELGPVRHLVSPNMLHYASIADWVRAYPEAIAWASPGVRERAAKQKIEVIFHQDLADEAPSVWADDIDQLIFRGSRMLLEVVFFHRHSNTLILTDLIENFELDKVPHRWHWLMRLGGVLDPDGGAPRDLRMTFWGRKDEARASLSRMLEWPTERVMLAHGRWYPENGMAELRRAFRWLDKDLPNDD